MSQDVLSSVKNAFSVDRVQRGIDDLVGGAEALVVAALVRCGCGEVVARLEHRRGTRGKIVVDRHRPAAGGILEPAARVPVEDGLPSPARGGSGYYGEAAKQSPPKTRRQPGPRRRPVRPGGLRAVLGR